MSAKPLNLHDYERLAKSRLHPGAWAYYSSGVGDEVTLRENRAAFEKIKLLPRMMRGVRSADPCTTVLGTPVSMPALVAPMAPQGLACPEGELATARAAGSARVLMISPTQSSRRLEDIAAVATGPLWFQLYIYHEAYSFAEKLVRRAERAGCRAVVLTVDAPRWSRKERGLRPGMEIPPEDIVFGNLADEYTDLVREPAALTWEDVEWLRSLTALPIILKGILTPEDAELAVEHGADGIVVSNHGGRQLDGVPAGVEALPGVVGAVGTRAEVYVDGGVRRGTDVLKALALGARAVLVGRPVLWGLAVDGERDVRDVLGMLQDELELAMALAGVPDTASVDHSLVEAE